MQIPLSLVEKYNVPVPRYTSYPPANFFSGNISVPEYLQSVKESNSRDPQNISIYIHIPFCSQLCLYCGCNNYITKDGALMKDYMRALLQEIRMISSLLDHGRKVSQVHWGGGTPNVIPSGYIGEVMNLLKEEFNYTDHPEIAMECNPAHLNREYVDDLAAYGFNRISLGIQDFREKVLRTVNREVPVIPVPELTEMIRTAGMSFNLDFIYGLPFQSADSFSETIDQALKISPDRLVTFSYAHVPWVKQAQKKLEEYGLPSANEKLKMFEKAWSAMKNAGYVPIGLDHYAKPEDDLAKALQNRALHRNFQGYCTLGTTGQVYAFGVTGISQLDEGYIQNIRDVNEYIDSLKKGELKIEKGYFLSEKEKIIRHVINEIMCNNYFSWTQVANFFQSSPGNIKKLLNFCNDKLDPFCNDRLLDYTDDELVIHDLGRFFLRNIAALFDPNIDDHTRKYSKAV